ncbi:hypothetical protein [Hyphomicrobium sp. DY-1]|uniref:hypothetical protein n=1 Tax=Hyphomicrobium sp. DY-1 TaxID=3075650 RepID=UPI0039C3B8C4
MHVFKDNADLIALGDNLAQSIIGLRLARYYATPEQCRLIDDAIDDFNAARKMVAKLTGREARTEFVPIGEVQECLKFFPDFAF